MIASKATPKLIQIRMLAGGSRPAVAHMFCETRYHHVSPIEVLRFNRTGVKFPWGEELGGRWLANLATFSMVQKPSQAAGFGPCSLLPERLVLSFKPELGGRWIPDRRWSTRSVTTTATTHHHRWVIDLMDELPLKSQKQRGGRKN